MLLLPNSGFQSTYLYKVRRRGRKLYLHQGGFNPRTYIRYDKVFPHHGDSLFQFQSTYLYKVRRSGQVGSEVGRCFNPRTYIRYDTGLKCCLTSFSGFNPRTYIRYDPRISCITHVWKRFQSTYLYKVRHRDSHDRFLIVDVSIHVPI